MDEHRRDRASEEQLWTSRELRSVEECAKHVRADGRAAEGVSGEPSAGLEYCVTTMTEDGMHRIAGITNGRGREDPELSDAVAANLRSVVRTLLDLMGQESGSARTRVVLTSAGPRIVNYERGPGSR